MGFVAAGEMAGDEGDHLLVREGGEEDARFFGALGEPLAADVAFRAAGAGIAGWARAERDSSLVMDSTRAISGASAIVASR